MLGDSLAAAQRRGEELNAHGARTNNFFFSALRRRVTARMLRLRSSRSLAAAELRRGDNYLNSGTTRGVIAPRAAKRVYLFPSCNSNVTGTCFHNVTGLPSRVPGTNRHLRASRRADSSSFA
jgi:hypothetical protein